MTVWVEGFEHRTGEHCASTALSNLLRFHGLPISEAMVVGLAGGLGFYYIRNDSTSPTRMYHGRTANLELDFCANAAIPVHGGPVEDDVEAFDLLKARLDAGIPVMLSTDTYYLGYQNTTSHFPRHRAVVVGYDDVEGCAWMADRKLVDYQRVSYEELRRSRNADDYPMACGNEYQNFEGRVALGRPLGEAIRIALRRNAEWMLGGGSDVLPGASLGIQAMRELAEDIHRWKDVSDWSWSARFAYQVVVKRGAGGRFFRSLYRDFLREAAEEVPGLASRGLAETMDAISLRWVDLADVMKDQSERETCSAELFGRAAEQLRDLADREESFFRGALALAEDDAVWRTGAS